MAKVDLKITRHDDHTLRVQAGRYVESIDITHRSKDDIVDACRWVAITGGTWTDGVAIRQILRELKVIA